MQLRHVRGITCLSFSASYGLRESEVPGLPVVSHNASKCTRPLYGAFASLTHLDLSLIPLNDDAVRYLVRLAALKSLDLSGTLISLRAIAHLAKHAAFVRQLRVLKLAALRDADDSWLRVIARFPSLRLLSLASVGDHSRENAADKCTTKYSSEAEIPGSQHASASLEGVLKLVDARKPDYWLPRLRKFIPPTPIANYLIDRHVAMHAWLSEHPIQASLVRRHVRRHQPTLATAALLKTLTHFYSAVYGRHLASVNAHSVRQRIIQWHDRRRLEERLYHIMRLSDH